MGRDERKNARREAYKRDREQAEREGGGERRTVLRDAVELDKLGIKEFRAGLAKDEKKGLFGVRLLPFHAEDPDRLMFPLHIHSNVGPDNLTFLCPVHMGKVFEDLAIPLPKAWRADPRCPECEEYEAELARYKEVRQGLSDDDRKAAYKRVSQHACYSGGFTEKKPNRALVFIADASARDTEGEVQVWLAPYKSVYVEGILEVGREPGTDEFIDLMDPAEALVYYFTREGAQLETRYYGHSARRRPWQIKDVEALLDSVPRVTSVLRFAGYDEIAEAAGGPAGSKAPDEEPRQHEDPPPRRSQPDPNEASPRKTRQEPEDEAPAEDDLAKRLAARRERLQQQATDRGKPAPAEEAPPSRRRAKPEPDPEPDDAEDRREVDDPDDVSY